MGQRTGGKLASANRSAESTTKILALDLGIFKTVSCYFKSDRHTTEYWAFSIDHFYLSTVLNKFQPELVVIEACRATCRFVSPPSPTTVLKKLPRQLPPGFLNQRIAGPASGKDGVSVGVNERVGRGGKNQCAARPPAKGQRHTNGNMNRQIHTRETE